MKPLTKSQRANLTVLIDSIVDRTVSATFRRLAAFGLVVVNGTALLTEELPRLGAFRVGLNNISVRIH